MERRSFVANLKLGPRSTMTSFDMIDFSGSEALARLEAVDEAGLDDLGFGVVGLDADGRTVRYNRHEAEMAGLSRGNVVGRHFFHEVAPCLNNYLVAERFEDDEEPEVDETLDYVLTFRMKPTKVKLRLLRSASANLRYLLIRREG